MTADQLRYADGAARREVERWTDWRKGGWRDIGLSGPLVSPALDYLRSRGLLERNPKKPHLFRVRDEPESAVPSQSTFHRTENT